MKIDPVRKSENGVVSAIILAGGSSRRMGRDKMLEPIPRSPKTKVVRRPLLAHSLLAFDRCGTVDEIIMVVKKGREGLFEKLAKKNGIRKLVRVVTGGLERQDSAWMGLQHLSPRAKIVLIHDAARPCVTSEIITRCVETARRKGAAIPAVPVKDTIKRVSKNLKIAATLDRSKLWAAQTPQTFRLKWIRQAYEPLIRRKIIVTDDACAVERMGRKVWIVESDATNLKVTTPDDLLVAEKILLGRKIGVRGQGTGVRGLHQ